MTIKERINQDMKESMKSKDTLRLSVIRMLKSTIKNEEIDKKTELNDEEVMGVIQREMKKRKESIESFRKGNREDLAQKEEEESKILLVYLPQQADDEEIRAFVKEVLAAIPEGAKFNMGMVMPQTTAKFKGRADGKRISKIVQELIER